MAYFFGGLYYWLLRIVRPLIGRVLVALGLGVVAYTGFDVGIDYLIDQVTQAYSGMPADILAIANILGVAQAMSIILSSVTSVLAVKGLLNATAPIKRIVSKC